MICIGYNAFARFCVPIFFMVSGALWLDPKRNVTPNYLFRHMLRLVTALIAWNLVYALFYIVKHYFGSGELVLDPQTLSGSGMKVTSAAGKALKRVSVYTFGVYLCHDLVIQLFDKIGLTPAILPLWLSIPVFVVILFTISLAFSYLLHQIPVVKKYIV